ncbi:MAG: cytochrome c3 family protein [Nitrospiraceae bacterium]|nr:cytochrome c3 family protein [Nitrospiraceae bacterium]
MKKTMPFPAIILLAAFMPLLFLSPASAQENNSCALCHGDAARMKALGYPQFTVTREELEAQTGMNASCAGCHMGDPQADDAAEAHKGFLTVMAIGTDWTAKTRERMAPGDLRHWGSLEPRGGNRAMQLMPKVEANGGLVNNPAYALIIWHDRNPKTLAFNPIIAERTCGKCHEDIVRGYLKSAMGGGRFAHTQSQYKAWTVSPAPQSCGLWVGKLSKPAQDEFTDENIKFYGSHSTMPIPGEAAFNLQRRCNQCHVGCLDCHYDPVKKDPRDPAKGPHSFRKNPANLSCYGGGKSFSCHAGPMERRRGDGYFRAEFTQASKEGKKILKDDIDIHMKKDVSCAGCHGQDKKTGFHADLDRGAKKSCGKCHAAVVRQHARGPHRKVDCASCHTRLIGGYAFNFWTVSGPKGKENPLTRVQDYETGAGPPIIIKDEKGRWIPVHVVPHTSGNVKAGEVRISSRLLFRDKPDSDIDRLHYSEDSYAVTGLAKNVDARDRDVMVWLNVDRIAHALGRARTCESCHRSAAQRVLVKFQGGSYKDVEDGSYTIIADKKGLRVTDFRGPKGGPAPKGLLPFADKWRLRGDFSLPPVRDKGLYGKLKAQYEKGAFRH